MAGLGRKIFTRERATVADVQGYLMDQTVMVFPSASARGTAISSSSASKGMVSFLSDVNRYEVYTGTAWAPLAPPPVRGSASVSGGVVSDTGYTVLLTQGIAISARDVVEGRRIVIHFRGVFGSGANAPLLSARVDGVALDASQPEVSVAGTNAWFFVGASVTTAGTKTVTLGFRSGTSGVAVSAGFVQGIFEVI